MDVSQQLVSLDSLTTFGGISVAVVGVTNAVKYALDWRAPWIALLVSLVCCVGGAFLKASTPSPSEIGLAVVNGCIVYSSAIGMNTLATAGANKLGTPGGGAAAGLANPHSERKPFFTHWF